MERLQKQRHSWRWTKLFKLRQSRVEQREAEKRRGEEKKGEGTESSREKRRRGEKERSEGGNRGDCWSLSLSCPM